MLSTSPTSLEHLKQARRFFERGMVREAAAKATPADVAALRETLELQRAADLGDADAFINADMRLHTQIAAITGNPLFEAVSEAMLGWLKTISYGDADLDRQGKSDARRARRDHRHAWLRAIPTPRSDRWSGISIDRRRSISINRPRTPEPAVGSFGGRRARD